MTKCPHEAVGGFFGLKLNKDAEAVCQGLG